MRCLLLGCGSLGVAVGRRLLADGHQVLGIRRHPEVGLEAGFPIVAGDASEPGPWNAAGLEAFDTALLCANPGLRRGRDNGLARIAALAVEHLPTARLVYTGSTSVYGDLAGGLADEAAPVRGQEPAIAGLLAIEQMALRQDRALVMRVAAIVGPSRTRALDRLAAGERTVRGDPDRPFSYIHESDLAGLCCEALTGGLGTGVLNVAAPDELTVAEYYRILTGRAELTGSVVGDGGAEPSRRIDASRLHRLVPGRSWLKP